MPASTLSQQTLRALVSASVLGLSFVPACVADEPGISDDETAGTSSSGEAAKAGSGGASVAGSSTDAGGAPTGATGGTAAGGHAGALMAMGGAGGSDGHDMGGLPNVAEGGQMNGQAGLGDGGTGTAPVATSCIFHTDAVGDPPGAGGAPPASDVLLQTNAFVGSYLTDTAGRTLYTYGADLPGDCNTPPTSGCFADCLVAWPIFEAGARVLGPGLDDAAFGSIDRGDGTWQTTYYGWPLYYYKSDLTLGQLTGQGKGKTWHVAELIPPSVQIMKGTAAKYLADSGGHTLYVSAADQAGTNDDDPVSACEGDCLSTFKPFRDKHLSVVTSLNEAEFTVFARASGGLQLAYKGLPLYLASTDLKSGAMTGLDTSGFTAAVP